VSAERIPRDTPPKLARWGEIAITKTQKQKRTPISNCEPLPNHVLPLARFGAPPTRHVVAAWCGPTTMMLTREVGVGAPSNTTRRFSRHLLVAATAKAHYRPGTFHSRHIGVSKGKLHN
jgi:hypothetical protein